MPRIAVVLSVGIDFRRGRSPCSSSPGHLGRNIAIWLSGYYHGKRGDTTLETQALIANAKKVRDYCFRHPQTLVMDAVEKVLGGERR